MFKKKIAPNNTECKELIELFLNQDNTVNCKIINKNTCETLFALQESKNKTNMDYQEFYNRIKHKANPSVNDTILRLYGREKCYKKAERFFYESIGVTATIKTETMMLNIYIKHQAYTEAKNFYRHIKHAANSYTEIAMLRLYFQLEEDQNSMRLYEKIASQVENKIKYKMFKVYYGQDKYKQAEEIYEQIAETANIKTHGIMCIIYYKQKRYAEAEKLYGQMDVDLDEIKMIVHNLMLEIYIAQKNNQKAILLYNKTSAWANEITEKIMINMYTKSSQCAQAEDIYHTSKFKHSIHVKTARLHLYRKQKRNKEAEELYFSMGNKADIVAKNIMLEVYCYSEQYAKAEKSYDEMPEKNQYTTKIMLDVYLRQEKYDQAEELYKQNNNQHISSKLVMLKIFSKQEKYTEAEKLYHSTKSNFILKDAMVRIYEKQGKLAKAESLYHKIKNPDIISNSAMLKIYAKQGCLKKMEELYKEIMHKKITKQVHLSFQRKIVPSKMLEIYGKLGDYDKAKKIYQTIKNPDSIIQNIMLGIHVKLAGYEQAITFFKNRSDHENLARNMIIVKCILQHEKFNLYNIDIFLKLGLSVLQTGSTTHRIGYVSYKFYELTELHKFFHRNLSKEALGKIEICREMLKTKLAIALYDKAKNKITSLTYQENLLLNIYCPNKPILILENKLDAIDILKIQHNAYHAIGESLISLQDIQKNITINRVNRQGIKLNHYTINHSIWHTITNGQLGSYVILKFMDKIDINDIPVYIKHNEMMYQTDLIGGSKLRARPVKNNYGAMIAVPVAAGEFLKKWFTSEESFYYGQRAFLPEERHENNIGLKGCFKLGIIPDAKNYKIYSHFIVKDGYGYIKASIVKQCQLKEKDYKFPTSHLTYQALQFYSAHKQEKVVKELYNKGVQIVEHYKQTTPKEAPLYSPWLYNALVGGLPTSLGLAVPVAGDRIILPDLPHWHKLAADGLIIGRGPYDSRKLQVIAKRNVQYSKNFKNLQTIQYTLTGYTKNNSKVTGRFFKGLLGVLPDEYWPKEYAETNVLLSSKDQKLCQAWQTAQDKDQAQNTDTNSFHNLRGVLLIKKVYSCKQLVGIPLEIARLSAGDFDGDEYNIISSAHLGALEQLIQKSPTMINPKIPKTFTPRSKIGNFTTLAVLHSGLLEKWTNINTKFCFLNQSMKKKLADKLSKTHVLDELSGKKWHEKLQTPDAINIVSLEIQLGMKYGQDLFKTKVPYMVLLNRVSEYEKALKKLLGCYWAVPYGKGFKKKLNSRLNAKSSKSSIRKFLQSYILKKRHTGDNLVAQTQIALTKELIKKTPQLSRRDRYDYFSALSGKNVIIKH